MGNLRLSNKLNKLTRFIDTVNSSNLAVMAVMSWPMTVTLFSKLVPFLTRLAMNFSGKRGQLKKLEMLRCTPNKLGYLSG